MNGVIDKKHIYFSIVVFTGKTWVYNVYSKEGEHLLGQVKWYASWRCYAFYPEPNCVFESQCMKDITSVLEKLMLDRKLAKQAV